MLIILALCLKTFINDSLDWKIYWIRLISRPIFEINKERLPGNVGLVCFWQSVALQDDILNNCWMQYNIISFSHPQLSSGEPGHAGLA